MQNPLVSIIIPNFNHASFLKRRIESVLSQSFQDFELIILDDFSNDDSKSIINDYVNHSKVSNVVFNDSNSGSTFKQWNKGVSLAKGKYIWFAESDDEASPVFLEVIMKFIVEYNLTLAYTHSYTIDSGNNITGDLNWWHNDLDNSQWTTNFTMFGNDFCSKYMVIKNAIMNASAVVFLKERYIQIGGASENMKLCGDWDLWTRIISDTKMGFVAEKLNYYRFHDTTVRAAKKNEKIIFRESFFVRSYCFNHFNIKKNVKLLSAYESLRNLKTLLMQYGKILAMIIFPIYIIRLFFLDFKFTYYILKAWKIIV